MEEQEEMRFWVLTSVDPPLPPNTVKALLTSFLLKSVSLWSLKQQLHLYSANPRNKSKEESQVM
jgi:hypothetical protein